MARRDVQRVTPRSDGQWQHRRDGAQRATRVTNTQRQAIESAVNVAKRNGDEVVVQGRTVESAAATRTATTPVPRMILSIEHWPIW